MASTEQAMFLMNNTLNRIADIIKKLNDRVVFMEKELKKLQQDYEQHIGIYFKGQG